MVLDPALSMENYILAEARSAFLQLRKTANLHSFVNRTFLITLVYLALVISKNDYCSALYMGQHSKDVQKLLLVQNEAARLVSGTLKYGYVSPVLVHLHRLLVCFQAKFMLLMLQYRALNGLGSSYLAEYSHSDLLPIPSANPSL